jgi:UDP-glucuronate decarboxylase
MDPNDGRVVSNFIRQALTSQPITLYGGGTQTRSFCYVSDLVDGIMAAAASDDSFHGPVNLGNPEEFTIEQLATKINRLLGRHDVVGFVNRPLPIDDPIQRKPDISLARRMLGFAPRVSIDEGLAKTIEYFRTLVV